ncbi:hypothetical protein E1B28_008144 [Marasmius oreades]|uniref:non-reducing end alpha-L-arabinofuranosidase n=1 Tax=Marasmius oreades TaxID=181124 RepID=A0A9P7URT8_9AGAR|nr:uncharacterized protein E1B28_008144 [Marasmius oreades]KAG7091743.1 hypothetical protein E1B28_008144 [Marasmius oreades]
MLLSLAFLALGHLGAVVAQTTVSVSATASHAIPTTLWGQMFEDISSGDGGLYAELLQNRAFQQVQPGSSGALNAWSAVNGAQISVVADTTPLSSAIPNSLNVVVPTGRTGAVGVSNSGYFGIKVTAGTRYAASFNYRFTTAFSGSLTATVSLQSSSGQVLASSTVALSGSQTRFARQSVVLTPSRSASDTNNKFVVTVDGAAASGRTIRFALFSLFPPTFKNRPNGLREDVAEALQEMGPKFFRFPGGNNVVCPNIITSRQFTLIFFFTGGILLVLLTIQTANPEMCRSQKGQTVAQRWQWNNTVGPLENRPGRVGDWGYINTDGLGLFEYLQWCEDVGMEAIMAIWSGFALGGTSVAPNQLGPFIQQAADQINFVIGDPTRSAPAALRSSLGHPAPFKLNHVEVGNEDFFAASTYQGRWSAIVQALQTQFPNITWFFQNAFFYDSFVVCLENSIIARTALNRLPSAIARRYTLLRGTYAFACHKLLGALLKLIFLQGEYAAISTNAGDIFGTPADGRLVFPTMASSSGEACFMTGLERNSDIVFAASYAPLLNHVANSQWTPNLVSFDSANVYRSTSFYVQKLFAQNRGDSYLPSTLPSRNGSLHWSVARSGTNGIIIKARSFPVLRSLTSKLTCTPHLQKIQVANAGSSTQTLTFSLPFNTVSSTGTLQLLTGASTASNTPDTPSAVTPRNSTITTGKTFSYQAQAFSVGVITLTGQ